MNAVQFQRVKLAMQPDSWSVQQMSHMKRRVAVVRTTIRSRTRPTF
jgi:hypothetical protein